MTHNFPTQFLWGTATAGHQIEGDNTASDTWFLESVNPTIFAEPSGRACNSWELWEEDLELVTAMGLNAYRFSIEWARVEPDEGQFSESALAHYENLLLGCLKREIVPIVTFSHFTAPHWFAKGGAWLCDDSADLFARYCGVVMDRLGDLIAVALTFNEPNLPRMLSWSDLPPFVAELERSTLEAASRASGVPAYRAGNVVLPEDYDGMRDGLSRAHLAAKNAIKSRRPDLPVGLSLAVIDDIAVAGGERLRDLKRREVYEHWLKLARADDFVGVQNYERFYYDADGRVAPPAGPIDGFEPNVDPDSLRGAVEYAYSVAGVPILVSEHGISTHDDSQRVALLEPALDGLERAMSGGVPVLGYCHWSLVDNFEWISGYSAKLGLHSVDRETFVRTAKPSARAFADAVKSRTQADVGAPKREE
ncbi:family 1 glycosylhydrolase [Microbacterium sp. X-17]|uniref:glycoside hydrolase family 1 protein n=1 Tax=Microbacterium sp. X-17 TaxID=3144404 RepID=UPI0031F59C86